MVDIKIKPEMATALCTAIFFTVTGCRDLSDKSIIRFSEKKLKTLGLTSNQVFDLLDLMDDIRKKA